MDMLSHLQKLVYGDSDELIDAEIKRDVHAAYCAVEQTPTPAPLLLERLLAQAEATPQLAAVGATDKSPIAVYTSPQSNQTRPRGLLARLFGSGRPTLRGGDYHHTSRRFQWEWYHEYIEQHLRQINAGNGLKPL